MSRNYYDEINKVVSSYEDHKHYHDKTLDWAANRIDWCWRWRKITREQMYELADRVIALFNEGF